MLFRKIKKSTSLNPTNLRERMIKIEAQLAGSLFGDQDSKASYQFFCFDEYTWILYKDSLNKFNRPDQSVMIRYRIHANNIYKQINGASDWQQLSLLEVENLKTAIRLYKDQVLPKLYPNHNWSYEQSETYDIAS